MRTYNKGLFLLACPAAIVFLYLCCECFYDTKEALYYLYPAAVRGMMILSVYLAGRSYAKEKGGAAAGILLSGIAVILPFADWTRGWDEWTEMMFEFAWFLWPALITCLGNYCGQKVIKNKKNLFGINFFIVLLLAVIFHRFAESMAGESACGDFCVPAIWLAESVLWSFVLNCQAPKGQRKRYLMAAWLVCLGAFGCLTFADISYLSPPAMWGRVREEWDRVIILGWPVLILFLMKFSDRLIAQDRPHFMQKRCLLCFLMVLPLVYVTANAGLNDMAGPFTYDVGRVFYCLFLTDIVLWERACVKRKQAGCRIKTAAFMAAINMGVFIFLLATNQRMQEILSGITGIFAGSVRAAAQADWPGYRKAAFRAFILKDLTVLDSEYAGEGYMYSVYGHGLTSIRFHFGMLPLLAMVLVLVLLVIFLWKWNQENIVLNQCARYFAAGCLVKMSISCILQAVMVVTPYMEFPFTGWDIAEVMLPVLLFWESFRVRGWKKQAKEGDVI